MKHQLFRKKSIKDILAQLEQADKSQQLKRNLNLRDLTALGIAAIVGAGIFSTIGTAAASGGPAVSLLFIFTAIACGFSAMAYAQFASTVPISGSAYTYAYVSFGEMIAWIIGWDLIMEYSVGNIAVAISWSEYFTGLMAGLNVNISEFLTIDFLSASRGYKDAIIQMNQGIAFSDLSGGLQEAYKAWTLAPKIGNLRIIADIPAFGIVLFITCLVYIGIQESKIASNLMVVLKLAILFLVILVGAFYVNPENWSPFAPNGLGGVMKGVAGVFFAYIGFDAISTTAEECKNPQRDLPKAMIYALIICTILYIIICLVLTGMLTYSDLAVGDPLAFVFDQHNLTKLSGIISVCAVVAMASVLLVFQLGQPRIWMSMSRDGLLPKRFSRLHKKFKTPAFATIITGILVAVPSLFLNLTEVTDLTSIGTLFAFLLVSGGILIVDKTPKHRNPNHKGFKIPYINSRYFLLPIFLIVIVLLTFISPDAFTEFFSYKTFGDWEVLKHEMPFVIFLILGIIISIYAIVREFSLIPVLGLFTNGYLMTELGIINWMRFLIWLAIGLVIYFLFGRKHSKMSTAGRL